MAMSGKLRIIDGDLGLREAGGAYTRPPFSSHLEHFFCGMCGVGSSDKTSQKMAEIDAHRFAV